MEKEFLKTILMEKIDEMDSNDFWWIFLHLYQKRSHGSRIDIERVIWLQFISNTSDAFLTKIKKIDFKL